jgi:formate C-acetyltransferase
LACSCGSSAASAIDQDFFDFCLETIAGSTCFPLMMNDLAVPEMLQGLGVSREDSFDYVPVGCNEIGIPGKAYFNPVAHVNYLEAVSRAMTGGRGYEGDRTPPIDTPEPEAIETFEDLLDVVEDYIALQIEESYAWGVGLLQAQMRWGQTPLTSCFFDGCIDEAHDLTQGTKYNLLSCGGTFFANMVDNLAAIREVVYEKEQATLTEVLEACRANYQGYERLRQQLLSAPKHGNDDPRLDDLIERVQAMRDRPMKTICRDPRDGTPCGNTHITRSAAVRVGSQWPATPDGRLAGTPLASSVAASCGVEERGPTALLNSILKLDPVQSWQSGYNVNIRFHRNVLADPDNREKARAMLNTYFQRGGQEMQINCADTAMLREAQKNPERYRDLVVRVAGFSEYFVSLSKDMQEDIIARVEHEL